MRSTGFMEAHQKAEAVSSVFIEQKITDYGKTLL